MRSIRQNKVIIINTNNITVIRFNLVSGIFRTSKYKVKRYTFMLTVGSNSIKLRLKFFYKKTSPF